MARRILNRKELRADFDAAERRKGDDDVEAEGEVEDEEEEDEEEEAEGDEEAAEEGDEEEAPATKKKKVAKQKAPKAPKAAKPKSRSRAAKVVRLRVVWGVFNNSNQEVARYDYQRKGDAEAHAAKLTTDKKQTHYIQPVKVAMEDKKD